MRREVMILLIVSLLTSCYNLSQGDLPKVQPSKAAIISNSIKPSEVKPSTIVNPGNNVNSTTVTSQASTIANSNTVVITTPIPSSTTSNPTSTNLSGGGGSSSTTTSSSSSTSISTPDVKEITFTPNPNYNYPPPSLSPDVPRSTLDGTQSPPPRIKPIYQNREIPTITNSLAGNGLVIFKDSFKVRMQTDGTLYSQTGADMSSINKLVLDYNVKITNSYLVGTTQEELDKKEKDMETFYQSDIPNDASMYYIKFPKEDTNVKEFLEKLRVDPKVWIADWSGEIIPS